MSVDNSKNPKGKKATSLPDPISTNIQEVNTKAIDSDNPPIIDPVNELRQILDKLMIATSAQTDRIHNEFLEIKSSQADQRNEVFDLKNSLIQMSTASSPDSMPFRQDGTPRKSSLFFGKPDIVIRPSIQVLQTDIVYDKELKVSSLEGLQYLAKQLQILSSKYPGRQIKLSHMVAYTLRPHVLAAWNSYCHQESIITGSEPEETLVENWLSLSNESVQAILIEAARPRTRELYSRDLVLFLGKGIPQSPPMSTDNFAKLFYAPLMKSLNDLVQLHDLLSEETSKFSNNKAKMPPTGFGTKESPGHIALWLISLGTQKDSVMQWLGKDNLSKYKALDPAVKFVRAKLMEGRSHSETRQDFDSKLTPIRYEDIRHTQGESNTRMQTTSNSHHTGQYDSPRTRYLPSRVGFSAIDLQPSSNYNPDDHNFHADIDTEKTQQAAIGPEEFDSDGLVYSSTQSPPTLLEDQADNFLNDTYAAMTDAPNARNAIAATYRGYCSELFVFGACHRRNSGCPLDHSSAGQERCIQSFALLTKRELTSHSKLPPWAPTKPVQSSFVTPRPTIPSRSEQQTNYRPDPRTETRYQRTSNGHPAQASNRHSGAYASSRPSST